MNIKSSCFYKCNVKNTTSAEWNRWNSIQKQCIFVLTKIKTLKDRFEKKSAYKTKWRKLYSNGAYLNSWHNIYISSMSEGNYMYNIYIQVTQSQETNGRNHSVAWWHYSEIQCITSQTFVWSAWEQRRGLTALQTSIRHGMNVGHRKGGNAKT